MIESAIVVPNLQTDLAMIDERMRRRENICLVNQRIDSVTLSAACVYCDGRIHKVLENVEESLARWDEVFHTTTDENCRCGSS